MAVEVAYADAGITGDRLQCYVGTVVRKGTHGDFEEPIPIALGVGSKRASLDSRHSVPPSAFDKRSLLRIQIVANPKK